MELQLFVGCMEFMMDMICMGYYREFFTDYLTGQLCCLLFFLSLGYLFCLFGVADTEGANTRCLGPGHTRIYGWERDGREKGKEVAMGERREMYVR